MTQQPVLVSVTKIIKILRDEGSLAPGELIDKVGVPKKTFYRALNALKSGGVVISKEGKYYWYELLDMRAYKTEFEAEKALLHSQNIASGLKNLIQIGSAYLEGELFPDPEYEQTALKHLKTGYAEIYSTYEKTEKIKKQLSDYEQECEEKIKSTLLASTLEMQYPENVAKIIQSDIQEVLRGRKPYFLNDLRVEGNEVKSGAYTSLVKKEMFEPFKSLVMKEERSLENRETCARIVNLESKHYILRQKLENDIRNLIMQVDNGTPLKGGCPICPKVKIIGSP